MAWPARPAADPRSQQRGAGDGDITAADLVGTLAGQELDALLDAFLAGNLHVNVHITRNPGGEVRGPIR